MADLDKFNRLIKRYPEVFRDKSFNYETFKRVFEKTEVDSNLTVCYIDQDIIHYIVMAMVMKSGRYLDINFVSAYELIDIYLGNVEDVSCLTALTNEVIAVYDGVGMPNKQKGNIIAQVADQQRMAGRKFWLFYKGNKSKLKAMYPEVAEVIDNCNFKELNYISATAKKEEYTEDLI